MRVKEIDGFLRHIFEKLLTKSKANGEINWRVTWGSLVIRVELSLVHKRCSTPVEYICFLLNYRSGPYLICYILTSFVAKVTTLQATQQS